MISILNKIKSYMVKEDKDTIKSCSIYKINKEYKIVTVYKINKGFYVKQPLVNIISINENIKILNDIIFKTLNESKIITYDEYYNSKNTTKDLLKALKVTSFSKIYLMSNSCSIYLENNNLKIVPYKKIKEQKGMVEVTEDILELEYNDNELEITEKIIEVLNKSYH